MKKNLKAAARLLLLAVFLLSAVMLTRQFESNRKGDEAHREALRIASAGTVSLPSVTLPPQDSRNPVWIPASVENDIHMDALSTINLAALREVNPDVIGWIFIPDTAIHYPLVQGSDNSHYLDHAWNGTVTDVGAIFTDCRNSPGLTDFNTVIYGHNLLSGAMFHDLRQYSRQDFWEAHPYIYILSDTGVFRYEIFSAFKTPVTSDTYRLDFPGEQEKADFLETALEGSVIDTGISPASTDRVITLSTCDGSGIYSHRWVVHGRLQMIEA